MATTRPRACVNCGDWARFAWLCGSCLRALFYGFLGGLGAAAAGWLLR